MNPKMKVMVCINYMYTRDQQRYAGDNLDNCHDETEDGNWAETEGSIIVSIGPADSIKAAIDEVAKSYGCSPKVFDGYQIADSFWYDREDNASDNASSYDACEED